MMRPGQSTHRIAAVLIAALVVASTSTASDIRYKIIIHPSNLEISIDRGFLRDAYLKKVTEWHGTTIRPIDLAPTASTRDQFTREVLKKTPAQLKSYWNQQIFSGKGVPPPEAETPAEVIAYVLANPGAIGYLPADVDPGPAKVVEVK